MSCPNRKYGCRVKLISYTKKRMHEEECIHKPCYCPFSGCDFVESSKVLSDHLSHKHGDFLIKFCYGKSFVVSLNSNDETIVLQEENDGKQFILNNSTTHLGNAINICSFGPNAYWSEYSYDILATSQKCKLKLHSIVKSVQRVTLENLSSELIVIPFGSSEYLKLEICITCVTLTMEVFVKDLDGKTMTIKVNSSDTVVDLKEKILYMTAIPVHAQRLIFAGIQLDDTRTLADYNIQNLSNINVLLRLLGD